MRNRDLAAGLAGIGLPFAESAHVGHRRARQRDGLRGIDLRIRRRRLCRRSSSSTQTTPSQNAIRKRKNMTLTRSNPRRLFAAFEQTVTDRPEAVVGNAARFLTQSR